MAVTLLIAKLKSKWSNLMFNEQKEKECPACKVYQDFIKAKDTEIERLNSLLNSALRSKNELEEKVLKFVRVIPPDYSIPVQQTQAVNTRLNWNEERIKLEKEAAAKTPEGESRRLYWAKKAQENPIVEHSGTDNAIRKEESSISNVEETAG